MAIPLTQKFIDSMVQDYSNGMPMSEIISKYEVDRRTVSRHANIQGVTFNNYENRRKIPLSMHDVIVQRYKNGEKPRDMAKEFGTKKAAVERIIAKKLRF